MKAICSFAYTGNDQQEYLNAVVSDKNTSKIIAKSFKGHIKDVFLEECRWHHCGLF